MESGEGKGAGPGAARLQTKESPTRWRPTELPPRYFWTSLLLRSQRSLVHRPAFPYLLGLLKEAADKMRKPGAPWSSKAKAWEG